MLISLNNKPEILRKEDSEPSDGFFQLAVFPDEHCLHNRLYPRYVWTCPIRRGLCQIYWRAQIYYTFSQANGDDFSKQLGAISLLSNATTSTVLLFMAEVGIHSQQIEVGDCLGCSFFVPKQENHASVTVICLHESQQDACLLHTKTMLQFLPDNVVLKIYH